MGKKAKEKKERIRALPSLLGRDIINRFRFIADRQILLQLRGSAIISDYSIK